MWGYRDLKTKPYIIKKGKIISYEDITYNDWTYRYSSIKWLTDEEIQEHINILNNMKKIKSKIKQLNLKLKHLKLKLNHES